MFYIKKKPPALEVGDILFCWDDTLKRTITGYILSVVKNKQLNDYDVHIRWNDTFVALQKASLAETLQFIRMGLWKHCMGYKGKK